MTSNMDGETVLPVNAARNGWANLPNFKSCLLLRSRARHPFN